MHLASETSSTTASSVVAFDGQRRNRRAARLWQPESFAQQHRLRDIVRRSARRGYRLAERSLPRTSETSNVGGEISAGRQPCVNL
jgi:hypothetical protein